jgi:hypothetical protein
MSDFLPITGMIQVTPNSNTRNIRFVLSVSEGQPIMCVASYGVAAQIASGLGSALRILRMVLASEGAIEPVAPETLSEVHIQRGTFDESVVMELRTTFGIPYLFQIPRQSALEIAERLKSEAEKTIPMGHA